MTWQYLRSQYFVDREGDDQEMDEEMETRGREGRELVSPLEKTVTSNNSCSFSSVEGRVRTTVRRGEIPREFTQPKSLGSVQYGYRIEGWLRARIGFNPAALS
jgi:hypothetical protein